MATREALQPDSEAAEARHLAERIADACLEILSGSGHASAPEERDTTAQAILASLDDTSRRRDTGRFLTTVLMTDVVDSTLTVARLGDRRWRELLGGHYADCRMHVDHGGGELVSTTGDGVVAIFDGPTRAIRAATAIQASARASGLAVRAGVHAGECERMPDGVAGLAVHIAARICALASADEIMTTGTVRDLMVGSVLAFEPRGSHELRGVPGAWTVFAAADLT
jgi:class 3 adenylate cyclase